MNIVFNKILSDGFKLYIVDKDYDLSIINKNLNQAIGEIGFSKENNLDIFFFVNEKDKIIVVKKDKYSNLTENDIRVLGFNIAKTISSKNITDININFESIGNFDDFIYASRLIEGLLQSQYAFDTYKKDKKDMKIVNYNINIPKIDDENIIEELKNIVDGVNITRELVNIPSIDLYPETLAKKAKDILEPLGVKVTVYGKKEIENMGMTAFLAVASGSDKEPKFIAIEYSPVESGNTIALVGKGLTYDSGGYAIKTPLGMDTMMADMAGSATVIGTIYSLAKNKIQQNVVGVIAACENMISGKSYKNGDIVSTMKGTTIEVKNTDAEGRVTLADSLYYAATKTSADVIIDLATLTGACVVGLGDYTTGVISNDDNIYNKLYNSSIQSGEYLWRLPIVDELRQQVKSKIADITNSTGKPGGAITAGIFLEEFADGKPWAHLDIAGPAYTNEPYSYIPYGGTGIPVKTVYNFIKNF